MGSADDAPTRARQSRDAGADRPELNPDRPAVDGYRDFTRVAIGGFSTVYTAYDESFARVVAVKVMNADVRDADTLRRFTRECEAAGRLSDAPECVPVFRAGATADHRPFIAMQYLRRGSLTDVVGRRGPLPDPEVVGVAIRMATVLRRAHATGLLHRDVKPGNILVSDDGAAMLSDFGVAALLTAADGSVSLDSYTPAHTAPEVLDGQSSTAAADVYALGSTLHTLLAGSPPFAARPGEGPATVLRRITAGEAAALPATVPADLRALIASMMAVEPADRPSAAEAVSAFVTLGERLGSRPLGDVAAPPALAEPVAESKPAAPAPAAVGPAGQPEGLAARGAEEPTRLRARRAAPVADPVAAPTGPADPPPRRGRLAWLPVAVGVVAVLALAGAGVGLTRVLAGPGAAPATVAAGAGRSAVATPTAAAATVSASPSPTPVPSSSRSGPATLPGAPILPAAPTGTLAPTPVPRPAATWNKVSALPTLAAGVLATTPNAAEQRLQDALRPSYYVNCRPDRASEVQGVDAALSCQSAKAGPTKRFLAVHFADAAARQSHVSDAGTQEAAAGAPTGFCSDGVNQSTRWATTAVGGALTCFWWSDSGTRTFRVFSTLDGSDEGVYADGVDGVAMYQWWTGFWPI